MRKLRNIIRTVQTTQWWVQDGNNMCKTTWMDVLSGMHNGDKLMLDYGKDKVKEWKDFKKPKN